MTLKEAIEKKDFQVIIISRKSGKSQYEPLTLSQIDNVFKDIDSLFNSAASASENSELGKLYDN
ncbi:MAG: hypothetical protein LBT63_02045, partial [Holosporaceae bacterium]|nr:hypothetical protein [Holosporaceae bacterium]